MDPHCVFCRIIAGQIPAEMVLESEAGIAIRDVGPQAPTHILVIPREHVAGMEALPAASSTWNALIGLAQAVALREGLDNGFRLVVNQGADGGQTVGHLHLHVLGGRALGWPPG